MKIAVLQPEVFGGKISHNLEQIKSLYLSLNVDLAIAPELALLGYDKEPPKLERHEAALSELEDLIRIKGIPLIIGVPYKIRDRLLNAALFLSPEGRVFLGAKVNLFPYLDELVGFSGADPPKPFLFKEYLFGSLICFDLRFPELAKRFAILGTHVLLVLAQWPKNRIQHFVQLLQARAIENQMYVVGTNALGKCLDRDLGGYSIAFDPKGEELSSLKDKPGIFIISLDKDKIRAAKKVFITSREILIRRAEEKILSLSDLLIEVKFRRQAGQKMVFTNGCFDLLHAGHVSYLFEARCLGDFLVVGLNSDNSLRRLKGQTRPIIPQDQRALILASLSCVDYVLIFEEETPENIIKSLCPDILVKGQDWPEEKIVGAELVISRGGKVVRLPFRYQISTSKIIEQIKKA